MSLTPNEHAMLQDIRRRIKKLEGLRKNHGFLPAGSISIICPRCKTELDVNTPVPIIIQGVDNSDHMVYWPAGNREDDPCE